MRKFARNLFHVTGTVAVAGTLALAGAALPANAVTTATTSATAASSATATATASSTATASPTAGTASPSSTSASSSSSSDDTSVSSVGTGLVSDPSLAEQNAAGDHAMGSTIPSNEPAATSGAATMKSFSTQLSPQVTPSGTKGVDVSAYQKNINYTSLWNSGVRFLYTKATEGTTYASAQFATQYNSAYNVGMIRGAYHFATPNTSSGATQATYFVNHGGGWSNDGRTLPPLLDIEYNPYGATCYGLSAAGMVSWISDFSNTVKNLTGVYPAIYSTTNWWKACTGNSAAFSNNPLFVAVYPVHDFSGPGALGASWNTWAMWQWTSSGSFAGDANRYDLDVMNASYGTLASLASPIAKVSTAATRREWGTNAYATAAVISQQTYSPGVDTVYVATRANYADALSGAPAAGAVSGPTLLVAQDGIPSATSAELARLRPKHIVILGGTAVIENVVATQLSAYTSDVSRIAGVNRFDTSAQVSAATYDPGVATAYIATGENFPDALAGAAIAAQSGAGKGLGKASNGGPMLLVRSNAIPDQIATELQRLQPKRIVIIGGTTAVNANVATALAKYTTGSVTRWAGVNRFATAATVATSNFSSSPTVFLATGTDFADALSGAPMAGWNAFPVLLVTRDSIPAETIAALRKLNPSKIVILGGPSAVSMAVQAAL